MRPIARYALRTGALLAAGTLVVSVAACRSMEITEAVEGTPTFLPEAYFLDRTEGWGVMQDRFGKLLRQCRI